MSSDDDENMECKYDTQEEVLKSANINTIPALSKHKYNKAYEDFQKWVKSNGDKTVTQTVLLKFFTDMVDKNLKPTTLWAYYSMLKATLRLNDNIDITPWSKVLDFLKRKNAGYKPHKAKSFTEAELEKFMNEAPDDQWLDVKVFCIFGINGTHSGHKLVSIKVENIKEYENYYWVLIPNAEIKQSFTITGNFFKIVKKYADLRPKKIYTNRFFLHYNEGKCTDMAMGTVQFYRMPRKIAKYLNLPNPEQYAGSSIRIPTANEFLARQSVCINPPKQEIMPNNIVNDSLSLSSIADQYDDHDFEDEIDQPIELDYETGLLKTSTVKYTPSVSVARKSNDTGTTDHVCTHKCSVVKCAKEDDNEKNAFHAFSITKSPDYAITEVIPAQFPTDPTCRWMVAYSHFNDPVSSHNWDEKFDEITKRIPNNVMVLQKYIRSNSSKLFAAYVVVYGVKCRCQKPVFGSMAVKAADTFRKRKFNPLLEERRAPAVFRKPNFDPLDSVQPDSSDLDDMAFVSVNNIKVEEDEDL